MITRGKGVRGGKGEINGDRRRLDLGWWTHNTIYRWCIIKLYTWTYIILLTNVTPINSVKWENIRCTWMHKWVLFNLMWVSALAYPQLSYLLSVQLTVSCVICFWNQGRDIFLNQVSSTPGLRLQVSTLSYVSGQHSHVSLNNASRAEQHVPVLALIFQFLTEFSPTQWGLLASFFSSLSDFHSNPLRQSDPQVMLPLFSSPERALWLTPPTLNCFRFSTFLEWTLSAIIGFWSVSYWSAITEANILSVLAPHLTFTLRLASLLLRLL